MWYSHKDEESLLTGKERVLREAAREREMMKVREERLMLEKL